MNDIKHHSNKTNTNKQYRQTESTLIIESRSDSTVSDMETMSNERYAVNGSIVNTIYSSVVRGIDGIMILP